MNKIRITTLVLIFILCSFTICFAQDINIHGLDKLDDTGNSFLYLATRIGKWIVIIMCIMDIIKCALNHNRNGVGQALVTYGMIYGAMFFVPYMMNMIEGVFQ